MLQAAEGARVVYGLMLLEERYPARGPLREQLLHSLLMEARIAARAALRYLQEGGAVPAYLLDLRDQRQSREREREEYRARACRINLGLLPRDDRGWHRKRVLDQERFIKRMQGRSEGETGKMTGLPEFVIISSLRGVVHRGPDRVRADRAYSTAVKEVEARGEGSVVLMSGSQALERYTLVNQRRGRQG